MLNEQQANGGDAAEQAAPEAHQDGTAPSPPDHEATAETSEAETITDLQTQLAETADRLLRTQAELENFRKRSQREQDDARRFESFRLVRDLLPAIDGLDRAIKSTDQSGDLQSLLDGIRMVYNQFLDVLKAHSTEQIPAEGKPFDPNLHEALTQVPTADVEPMTIVQVVETGYKLHDRVVRPARVIVACAPEDS